MARAGTLYILYHYSRSATSYYIVVLRSNAPNSKQVGLCVYWILTVNQVESAVETRTVDKAVLTRVAVGRIIIAVEKRLVNYVKSRTMVILDRRIKAHYAGHIFEAYARLDLPTFEDPLVRRQLEAATGGHTSVAWDTVQMLANTLSHFVQLVSQVSVLLSVLRGQRDGTMIALLSFISPLLQWMRFQKFASHGSEFSL